MTSLDKAVAARLAAQVGQEEASALWEKLWAAFQAGGEDGAAECISALITTPQDEADAS